jgi:hypothetical protein
MRLQVKFCSSLLGILFAANVSQPPGFALVESAPAQEADAVHEDKLATKSRLDRIVENFPDQYPPARYAAFPMATLKMIRPEGFADCKRLHGFENEDKNALIFITMSPVPFETVTKQQLHLIIQDESLQITEKYSRNVEVSGKPGILLHAFQKPASGLTRFAKYVIVFGDDRKSWVVAANCPSEHAPELEKMLLEVLMSTEITTDKPGAPGSDLDFVLSSEKLKITPGWLKAFVFTKDGVFPLKSPHDPFFRATRSTNRIDFNNDESNRKDFARQVLQPAKEMRVDKVSDIRPIELDGVRGYESLGVGKDTLANVPMYLYSVTLFDGDMPIVMNGAVGADLGGEFIDEFKELARSFKRRTE